MGLVLRFWLWLWAWIMEGQMGKLEDGRLETRDLEVGMNEKEEYLQVPTSATTSSTARCIYAVST